MNDRKKLWIVSCLALFLIGLYSFIDAYNKKVTAPLSPQTSASDFIVDGEYETKGITYACTNEANFKKMMELLSVEDTQAIEAMKWSVEIIPLPKNTRVKVISNTASSMKIKILDGSYENSYVYIMWTSLK